MWVETLAVEAIFGHRRIRAILWLAEHNDRYQHGLIPVEVVQFPLGKRVAPRRNLKLHPLIRARCRYRIDL